MAYGSISVPGSYSEWVALLDMLKDKTDDEAVLSAMKSGKIDWQSGVAERFTMRLVDAVNSRMDAAVDKFQKEMSRAAGQERAIVQALYQLRKELSFLAKATDLPAIPEKDRKRYTDLVIDQANAIQRSLEDSARNDRTGKLSVIIRNNKVNSF